MEGNLNLLHGSTNFSIQWGRKYTKIQCAFVSHFPFFLKFGGPMSANTQSFCHLSSKRWNHNRKSWTLTMCNSILDGPLDKLVLFLRPQKRSNLHSMPPFGPMVWPMRFTTGSKNFLRSLKIQQSSISNAGSLSWWDDCLIGQASDVTSIIFFINSCNIHCKNYFNFFYKK